MTYKTILVHAEPSPARSARLRCAAALAEEFAATVVGLGAEAIPPLDVSIGGGYALVEGEWIAAMHEQITVDLVGAEKAFREAAGSRPCEWRTSWSMPTQAMAQTARAADLIVAGGRDPATHLDVYRAVDTGQLIITSGCPVLSCPPNADHLPVRTAVVAWKDTREARRAVADALPLLKRAPEVIVLEVCPDSDKDAASARTADVAAALGRHGVAARAEALPKKGPASEALLDYADRRGVGLIVAGGYGHSRLGEWVFGGLTRALLEQDRHFVLFSH